MSELTLFIDDAEAVIEEILPQAGGIVLDIGRINQMLISLNTIRNVVSQLEEESKFLDALRSAGVDSWEGYEIAQESCEG